MALDTRKQRAANREGAITIADIMPSLKERLNLEVEPPQREIVAAPERDPVRTSKGFIGRIASGRGRVVSADDSSYAIEANPPLNAREIAYTQKHGFDDESPAQDGSLMIADKKTLREASGDVNHVAMLVTGKDAGRER